MDIKDKVKNLTTSPGVYLMRDSLGNVIYIGKAKNLKNRVQTYFYDSPNRFSKIEKLVKNIKDFDYIVTDTEFEALILECKLIRQLKPRYNKLMKNPLSYIYIVVKNGEPYPSIDISNTVIESDQNLYFGPYTNRNAVEKAIEGVKECYKILCNKSVKKNSQCLNYALGLCVGMCTDVSAAEYYKNIIEKFISFLMGNDSSILEDMNVKMEESGKNLDFETAARYRDYIKSISYLLKAEKTLNFVANNHIIIMEPLNKNHVKIFFINNNKIVFSKKYMVENGNVQKLQNMIKKHILACLRNNDSSSHSTITKDEIDEAQIIFGYLNSKPDNYILIPKDWLNEGESFWIDEAIKKLVSMIS